MLSSAEGGPSPGDDRDLVDLVGMGETVCREGMANLVVGDDPLFLRADQSRPPLRPGDNPVHRLFQLGHRDLLQPLPARQQGGLVHHIGEIGPSEAWSPPSQDAEIDLRIQGLSPRVDPEDGLATGRLGGVQDDLPVEPAGA